MDVIDTQPAVATEGIRGIRPDGRGSALGAAAIFLLTVACHLPLLGAAPLGGTEGHRVFPSLAMVRTGDWILPRLYGQLYLIKPPLHDWFIAITQILSGGHGNEFVWRLPSVIEAGLLNVVLYWFGGRWFGRVGAIVSGIGGLAMIALWGQARTADVDATNTLFCTLAALCLVELHFGRPERRAPWIWGAGVALGATLLTKGPAGLPLLVGVLIWAIWRARRADTLVPLLRSSATWGPLLIGAAMFGAYAAAAKFEIARFHLHPDYSGFEEAGNTLLPRSFERLGKALLVPLDVFAYTMPVSIALVLALLPGFRRAMQQSADGSGVPRGRVAQALAASILISWGVCLASGMINPRYGYVTVPPLAILAGALAAAVPYFKLGDAHLFRAIVLGTVVVLAGGNWVIAALAWRGGIGHVPMLVAAMVATVVAVSAFRRLRAGMSYRPAWGLIPLLVLAAVPFAFQFRLNRFDRSAFGASPVLRAIVDERPDAPVLAGAVLHSQPELFWYAGLHPRVVPTFAIQNPKRYPGDLWVVMDKEEHARWRIFAGARMTDVRHFSDLNHKYDVFVGWYERARAERVATEPATRPSGRAAERESWEPARHSTLTAH